LSRASRKSADPGASIPAGGLPSGGTGRHKPHYHFFLGEIKTGEVALYAEGGGDALSNSDNAKTGDYIDDIHNKWFYNYTQLENNHEYALLSPPGTALIKIHRYMPLLFPVFESTDSVRLGKVNFPVFFFW